MAHRFVSPGIGVCFLLAFLATAASAQQDPSGLALAGTSVVEDAVRLAPPDAVQFGGLLGNRYDASFEHRLLTIDEDELLSGYRQRPGKQAWVGEHVGKWLHAASLTFMHSHDPRLGAKLDRVAFELLKCQEPDGYLGTYTKNERFGLFPNADWDVWSHKYCIIGLLAYYQATGNRLALEGAKKACDLLISTFGPGGKSLVEAGTHQGMAATSVLEPVVLLYRATADPRYLEFAKSIVAGYDAPGGPRLLADLLAGKQVRSIADAKAYEMLSNLVGLLELYRATGDRKLLDAVTNAWQDIAEKRLYITGTGSSHEVWTEDGVLPNDQSANVGETCVTVTWEQLNLQLYRLLGQSRFMDQIERSVYNHLLGAQRPDGGAWCYYTPLNGRKYPGSDTTCCLSSGPRGVALLPTFAYGLPSDGVDVNLYGTSTVRLELPGGILRLAQQSAYPTTGKVELKILEAPETAIAIRLRIPEWAATTQAELNGKPVSTAAKDGYITLRRRWVAGERVTLDLPVRPRVIPGSGNDDGMTAVQSGPVVLAIDQAHNPALRWLSFTGLGKDPVIRRHGDRAGDESVRYSANGFSLDPRTKERHKARLTFVPFYAAGQNGSPYAIWLLGPDAHPKLPENPSLFAYGEETSSRIGNQTGSFADGDAATFAVTFDGARASEDWYAVASTEPVTISRVVFRHGASFHDGGWFDTSAGKPRIQIRKSATGPWQDVATLDSYPETDALKQPPIEPGQAFEVRFAPIKVYGVRILGKPSCGDNPEQSFSSCAELEAFGS